MKLKVLRCVCSDNSVSENEYSYIGMPFLKVTSDMNFWEAFIVHFITSILLNIKLHKLHKVCKRVILTFCMKPRAHRTVRL